MDKPAWEIARDEINSILKRADNLAERCPQKTFKALDELILAIAEQTETIMEIRRELHELKNSIPLLRK